MLKLVRYKPVLCCVFMVASCLPVRATIKIPPTVITLVHNSIQSRTKNEITPAISESRGADSSIVEEFSFHIKDFKMDHQSEINNLNLSVRYRYVANILQADYPDFRRVAKYIEGLLADYPNRIDYWEIVNKKLTRLVLDRYSTIQTVTIEMLVSPSPAVAYTRASIVTRTRINSKNERIRKQKRS